MLSKLLKYDLKSMLKTLVPLWIVAIVVSAFYGIFNGMLSNYELTRFILILTMGAIFVAIVVINIMLIVQRFWNGLLKEEGYLMFTIPTTPRMLIISKAISATIISLITGIVATVCVVSIMALYVVQWDSSVFTEFISLLRKMPFQTYVSLLIFLVTCIVGTIQKIYVFYAAMAIGHLTNKNRFLLSVGAYMLLNIAIGSVSGALLPVYMKTTSMFNLENMEALSSTFNVSMIVAAILCAILTVALHALTEWILSKRLNLE